MKIITEVIFFLLILVPVVHDVQNKINVCMYILYLWSWLLIINFAISSKSPSFKFCSCSNKFSGKLITWLWFYHISPQVPHYFDCALVLRTYHNRPDCKSMEGERCSENQTNILNNQKLTWLLYTKFSCFVRKESFWKR